MCGHTVAGRVIRVLDHFGIMRATTPLWQSRPASRNVTPTSTPCYCKKKHRKLGGLSLPAYDPLSSPDHNQVRNGGAPARVIKGWSPLRPRLVRRGIIQYHETLNLAQCFCGSEGDPGKQTNLCCSSNLSSLMPWAGNLGIAELSSRRTGLHVPMHVQIQCIQHQTLHNGTTVYRLRAGRVSRLQLGNLRAPPSHLSVQSIPRG